jgi:hypothetical protein
MLMSRFELCQGKLVPTYSPSVSCETNGDHFSTDKFLVGAKAIINGTLFVGETVQSGPHWARFPLDPSHGLAGMGTVRMCPAFPTRSTTRPVICPCMVG